jgi:hypothetical protein
MTRLPLMLVLLGAAGCAEYASTMPEPPMFGDAVRQNMIAQIIAPEPSRPDLPPADGVRLGLMMQRYQADKVTPPIPAVTTTAVGVDTGQSGQ